MLREAGVLYTWEDAGMFRHCPGATVTPDISFADPEQGVLWALDVTVADAQGASSSPVRGGAAVASAEQRKIRHYQPACEATPGASFCAVGLETFGGLGTGAQRFIDRLVAIRQRGLPAGESEDDFVSTRLRLYYSQRLVIALLRSEAQALRRQATFDAFRADPALPDDASLLTVPPRLVPPSVADLVAVVPPVP